MLTGGTEYCRSSLARIEKTLNKYIAEVRSGEREGSVVSTEMIESASLNDQDAWRELRRELEDMGVSTTILNQHRRVILDWFRRAIEANLLEDGDEKESFAPSFKFEEAQFRAPSSQKSLTGTITLRQSTESTTIAPTQKSTASEHKTKKSSRFRLSYLPFILFQSDAELLNAARCGDVNRVNELLGFGINVNYQSEQRWTALHAAARYGHEAVVQLLLERGAKVNSEDNHGTTALHQAVLNGHAEVAQLLLGYGANVQVKDNYGRTALYEAVSPEMVDLLVENGADLEAKDKDGRTALHSAALNGREAAVQSLQLNGADLDAKDIDERTALQWAELIGHKGVMELLTPETLQS